MLLPPAEIIAKWPAPNYKNPEVKGHYMPPILIFLMTLTAVVVVLRLLTRWRLLKSFGSDDWLIIPATLTAFGCTICNILSVNYGMGVHIWNIPLVGDGFSWFKARQLSWATQIMFTLSIGLTKISILLFYMRFSTTPTFKWAIRSVLAFVTCWMIAMTFLVIFQCVPVDAYWSFIPKSRCLTQEVLIYQIHGGFNLFSDVLVLILPVPTVLKLRLPLRQKISLLCLFMMGILVCIAGALRLVSIYHVSKSFDVSWYGYDLWVYTSTECLVGILCASAPSLKPIVIKFFPAFGTTAFSKDITSLTPVTLRSAHMGMSAAPYGAHGMAGYPMNAISANKHQRNMASESEETIITRSGKDSPPPVPPKSGVVKTTEIEVSVHNPNDSPV